MPGKVKVKIISGKNLPVMDRSSDTTDAYVEIKLGNTTYKTDVCRRTLHPQWNTDWYKFEVDDSELQDEPLQIRLMDHDTYSANDAIGKVYLNLNPLLLPVAGQLALGDNNPNHEISGWIPVFDTMHGIRGEVNVTVKVELFSDFNRFRQSSCGVYFFYSPIIPQGYQAKVINGFVEELIVDDDPEYQWIDKIRTPRASNEARQTLFFKLSGELQRKIGVKALGLGGNAVIGYKQCFDLEGESGIVARGIGTAVTLVKATFNAHHAPVEAKDEDIETYLKFVGDGKSFSLCSTSPPHKFHFPRSLFNPLASSLACPDTLRLPKLTKRHYVSLDSHHIAPSCSNPDLNDQSSGIKILLRQEDKRGKSALSRRFQKFKHSQKCLSKKMIALKAKLNDSIGEESDEQSAVVEKRKLFKRTSSDSSAMAEILARSVMRATTSLSCILEDQPHSSNKQATIEKLESISNLLTQSESDMANSDILSITSTDSSSSGSEYDYIDYSKSNNDVETLSNIIDNVEKLQRCLSRDGLHKQYSLPSIPTKGFSLSSLDNFSQFESEVSGRSSISNLSEMCLSNSDLITRGRSYSDFAQNKAHKLQEFYEIDSQFGFEAEPNAIAEDPMLSEVRENICLFDEEFTNASYPALERNYTTDPIQEKYPVSKIENIQHELKLGKVNTSPQMMVIQRVGSVSTPDPPSLIQEKLVESHAHDLEPRGIAKIALETMLMERADLLVTSKAALKTDLSGTLRLESHESKDSNIDILEPKGIVKTALETMLIERANLLNTSDSSCLSNKEYTEPFNHEATRSKGKVGAMSFQAVAGCGAADSLEYSGIDNYRDKLEDEPHIQTSKAALETDLSGTLRLESHESKDSNIDILEPKGIVKTALETMLIERANLLNTSDSPCLSNKEYSEPFNHEATRSKGKVGTMSFQAVAGCGAADSLEHSGIDNYHDKLEDEPHIQTSKAALETDLSGTLRLESHKSKDSNIDILEPKGIVKTALETMLIERANLLNTSDSSCLSNEEYSEPFYHEATRSKGKVGTMSFQAVAGCGIADSLENSGIDNYHDKLEDEPHIQTDILKLIAPVSLENINIKPKKMVKAAMQTMLLEKFNLLGSYTPPTSPVLANNAAQNNTFTFADINNREMIPKSPSGISFEKHTIQHESVLGMPFTSLSSLSTDYESSIQEQRNNFLSDSYLHQPFIDILKDKTGARKKRFKFRLPKPSPETDANGTNIFQKLGICSKKNIADNIGKYVPKEPQKSSTAKENILSRMFHKPSKDESTQTSSDLLNTSSVTHPPECHDSSFNNLSENKNFLALPKTPSPKDSASGDFLTHSKTKSACLTSHHSSPAQEREDLNDSDKNEEHSPDRLGRLSHSPVKVNYMLPLHRRSSDSDLSITPKGNSLTGSDKSAAKTAAYFMRNNYSKRGQMNQEHLDMLEYPFLTMTKFPPRFIIQIGGSISARSVKLMERILNVEEPESRDTWWSEIRMEIRSHARSLNCNAVLGYTELTSICDDVCVLSACGTAAVIDFNSSAGDEDNVFNVQLIHKVANGHQRTTHDSPEHRNPLVYTCCITHLPYDEKTVPVKAKVSKCPICLKGKVPEVLIATIEPPESIPSIGKGCFIESHVSRPLKDLRGEMIAKEISDGLPFLEYELHRLLVNKLKIKGMNAIFSLKVRIGVGEKMLVGVATGTAIYLSCLPAPDLPMLVTDKVQDGKFVSDLQEMLHLTVKKNRELYQIKDENLDQRAFSDEDSDEEQTSLDMSCGNKDCCILEMDDPEDAEVLKLLMQEKVPDGFHVVSTESVPGLEDLEIVKNLQMFIQIYRAKLVPPYNLQKHFVRLLQSVYFKLRRMVPCALCDLQFRIDIPEADELQLCVIGMALGLRKKLEKRKSATTSKNDDDLIFKLDDDHPQDQLNKSNTSSLKIRSQRSPSKHRPQSVKQRHLPNNEQHGVDITPLSYVPGGNIEQYLGNLNFFFIRETTSIREEGGLSGFIHSFITEVLAIVRSHVIALGGNALVAFFMTECVLNHNLHKNQGQCLINVGGDVVSVSYCKNKL